jgi:hypothetical protein
MLTLPISAKIKAVVGLIAALVIVATGVTADSVLDLNDVAKYGVQLVEAIGAYVAIFKAPRNRPDGFHEVILPLEDGTLRTVLVEQHRRP